MENELDSLQDHGGGTVPGSDHPCKGCLHWYGCYEITKCCNYIFDMDRRRPCPPGAACTVKRPIRCREDLRLRKGRGFLGWTF